MTLKNSRQVTSGDKALRWLVEGNERFLEGKRRAEDLATPEQLRKLADEGQKPFAIILSCSDSRVPAELIFDQGFGDLFMIRVAGNVVAPSLLASMEFAAVQFGTPILVVMGHTQCGAIHAALKRTPGMAATEKVSRNFRDLLDRLEPPIRPLQDETFGEGEHHANLTPEEREAIENRGVLVNVRHSLTQIRKQSTILRSLESSGALRMVGAVFHLKTGRVHFDHHPDSDDGDQLSLLKDL